MEAFQIVQNINEIFGIYPAHDLNYIRILLFFLSRITTFTASLAYFIFKAESIDEYGTTFYMCTTSTGISICFITTAVNMGGITKLIQKFRIIARTSEFILIFKKQFELSPIEKKYEMY